MQWGKFLVNAALCQCWPHDPHLHVLQPVCLQQGWEGAAKGDDSNQHTWHICSTQQMKAMQCRSRAASKFQVRTQWGASCSDRLLDLNVHQAAAVGTTGAAAVLHASVTTVVIEQALTHAGADMVQNDFLRSHDSLAKAHAAGSGSSSRLNCCSGAKNHALTGND